MCTITDNIPQIVTYEHEFVCKTSCLCKLFFANCKNQVKYMLNLLT
jgi:hypothetical protein